MRTMIGLTNVINKTKPTLFIWAKTYGAAKKFLMSNCNGKANEKALDFQFQDIVYLCRAQQLCQFKPHEAIIVKVPRFGECKDYIDINMAVRDCGSTVLSAAKFLEQLKPE